jgi:hypothetical protein
MLSTPGTVETTPSSTEVTSCSITLAGARGHDHDTVIAGIYLVGLSCSESKGITAIPIVISNTKITFMVKEEKAFVCDSLLTCLLQ